MSAKFESTSPKESDLDLEHQSECLRLAFAILGQLILDRSIEVDFTVLEWENILKYQAIAVAETIYNARY